MFQSMYYWDTYFANVGLILSGMVQQAKNNVDNMFHLINTYGHMPNGNRRGYLNRSQPPFLSLMVRHVFEAMGDVQWLKDEAYPALEKEYAFWQGRRNTCISLNRYSADVEEEEKLIGFAGTLCSRCGVDMPEDRQQAMEYGRSMFSLAESGWDCTSRFALDAHKHAPADLNSLLYMLEKNMAYFADVIGKTEDIAVWNERAEQRKDRMNRLLWSEKRGVFCDVNYESGKLNDVVSCAAFYPLFAGFADERQAESTVRALALLEQEYGVACCEKMDDLLYLQWDYPHGWACLHYTVIRGLLNYGRKEDALRIAEKYVNVAAANFKETENLWEKYNVVTGKVSVTKEYKTPPMMGWSAGVYLYCERLLRENGR
jgi:alpha,alpha-trehalase